MIGTTLATIALVTAAAGTATSVTGQIKAGNAAKRAGKAQQDAAEDEAQLAEYNAGVAKLQAQDALARGAEAESKQRASVRMLIGSQRAGYAASNIDAGYGSAADVQADAAFLGELDALTIRTNAAREAWGYEVQEQDLLRRAAITRKEGVQAARAGEAAQSASRWGAAGTLVTGGANLLAQSYGFKQAGGSRVSSGPRTTVPTSAPLMAGGRDLWARTMGNG